VLPACSVEVELGGQGDDVGELCQAVAVAGGQDLPFLQCGDGVLDSGARGGYGPVELFFPWQALPVGSLLDGGQRAVGGVGGIGDPVGAGQDLVPAAQAQHRAVVARAGYRV